MRAVFGCLVAGLAVAMTAHAEPGRAGAPIEYARQATGRLVNTAHPSVLAPDVRNPTSNAVVGAPYEVNGKWFVPTHEPDYDEVGVASWYGPSFHQKATASGEIYDQEAFTGAHPTLPIPSIVRVTNIDTGRTLIVRINDRGPYVDDRLIDLSHGSAVALGVVAKGTARVRVQYVGPASAQANATPVQAVEPALAPDPFQAKPVSLTPSAQGRALIASSALPAITSSPRVAVPAAGPQPVAYASAPSLAGAPKATLMLQAGAFGDLANAMKLQAALQSYGATRIDAAEIGGALLYRVQLGPFADRSEAARVQDALAAAGRQTILQPAR